MLTLMGLTVFLASCNIIAAVSAAITGPLTITLDQLDAPLVIEYATTVSEQQRAEVLESDRQVIVALHGYTDSWHSFKLLMEEMPDVAIYALSLPCYGGSSKDIEIASSCDALANTVVAFMDSMGIAQAYIMGHSMSSILAPRIAYLHPSRVAGLALLGPIATLAGPANAPTLASLARLVDAADAAGAPTDYNFTFEDCYAWQAGGLALPVDAAFLRVSAQETTKAPLKCWRAGLALLSAADFTDTLRFIAAPVLVIVGAREWIPWFTGEAGDSAVMLGEYQSAVTLAQLPAAGHSPHWEVPGKVAAVVHEFLERGNAAAGAGAPQLWWAQQQP